VELDIKLTGKYFNSLVDNNLFSWGGKSRSVAIALSYILKKNFERFSF
jgi:hypothetical protein